MGYMAESPKSEKLMERLREKLKSKSHRFKTAGPRD